LDAQPYELDNLFIPPAIPGARLLLLNALASRGEDAIVVPPASINEDILAGE
jgi:hypothetical protein